ncbi:MAG: hypothetical protein ACP5HM_10590 [Anaerolineae bacterium]
MASRQPVVVAPTPIPISLPAPLHFDGPQVGVNVHVWWDAWASQRDWRLAYEADFTWAKQRLPWAEVRPVSEMPYDWSRPDRIVEEAEAWGLQLVFRLDYPPAWATAGDQPAGGPPAYLEPFAAFCGDVAARYRGRVAGYQVWNEPNLAREWGGQTPDPVAYTELLRVCAVAIRQADPQALVISAGLAPTGSGPPVAMPDTDFLTRMYEAGAAPYFDLLGAHAPGYAAPPEISPEEAAATPEYGGQRFFCFRRVEDLRAIMVQHGDAHKQVAILEFGWTTDPVHPAYSWFAVTPEQQADYLVRAITYAREHWTPWSGPMFIWNIPDAFWTPEDEEFWWGIVDPFHWESGGTRPAYEALRERPAP